MTVTVEDLKQSGYRRYDPPLTKPHAVAMWQKPKLEGQAIRYYICAYQYSEMNDRRTSFQYEVNFSLNQKPFYAVCWDRESIEEVEDFFHDIWTKLGCDFWITEGCPLHGEKKESDRSC